MPANQLINEKSPYLLQHANNPVMWYPWGNGAFDKARLENKPILLSIGYSTCHWCHVMAHESFEDEILAAVINAHFIAIKVDREERPDIDHVYMSAVTGMTGQGGWPLTVFLTPDGRPFYGGTYFPPYAKWGSPGFNDVLSSISQAWQQKPGEIEVSAAQIIAHISRVKQHPLGSNLPLDAAIFNKTLSMMEGQFDPHHGGFGSYPKFPMGHNLSLLLRIYKSSSDEKALSMAEETLDAMANGGIYDHLGGGFHRYATDAKWHLPHFEKMLYDQALLIIAYTECFQITGDYLYAQIVHETITYVLRDLRSPQGGFYSAQDADTDGQEGKFYVFSYQEIIDVLTGEDADIFIKTYGVVKEGNVEHDPHGEFIHQNVLSFSKGNLERDNERLARCRQQLLAYRNKRNRPHLDDKVLTDWNGLMITALSVAGAVFNRDDYIAAAEQSAEFILSRLSVGDALLLHRWRDGEAGINGMLDDYAFFAMGLISLYESTGTHRYLTLAQMYGDAMIRIFADEVNGGFFMTPKDVAHQLFRPKTIYDGAIPSGNAVAGLVLKKLYQLTQVKRYNTCLERLLEYFYPDIKDHPVGFTFYLQVLDYYLNPAVEFKVKARLTDGALMAGLRKVIYKRFSPHKSINYEDSDGALRIDLCQGGVCLAPVNTAEALAKLIV